jgi:hypothetical protein
MDPALKDGMLKWLKRYRAAAGAERQRLGAQIEAFAPLCSTPAEQAWADVVIQNQATSTPIALVAQRADLAYAETSALLLSPSAT